MTVALLEQIHQELRDWALLGSEQEFNQLLRIAGDVVEEMGGDPLPYQVPWLLEPCGYMIAAGWVRINWLPQHFNPTLIREQTEKINQFPIGPFPARMLHSLQNTTGPRLFGYNLVWRSDWAPPHNSYFDAFDFLTGFIK